jgi:acyl-CoA thioester hydrolase
MPADLRDDAPETGIRIEIPIRWGDMDALGHVNNIFFFQYCESARMAYFEALDLARFQTKPTDGPGMVRADLNFRRQLHSPGNVAVTAHVTALSTRTFTISYVIHDLEAGEVAAEGDSVCVWVDYESARAMPLPDPMIDAIVALEKNESLRRRDAT